MQISIDSDLMDEIVAFVGDQPCKKSYVLYTKLLIAVREDAERRRAEIVAAEVPIESDIAQEPEPKTIVPAETGPRVRKREGK